MDFSIKTQYTELWDIAKLIPHPRNTRKHSDKQIEYLATLFKYTGIRHPIIVSKRSGFVVAGHARREAAKLLGYKKFPVDIQDFENEAEEYAFLEADNNIAELAEHDREKMLENIRDLPDLEVDMLGLLDLELPELEGPSDAGDGESQEEEEEEEIEADKNIYGVQRGDIWILGDHRLMCGDSRNEKEVRLLLNGEVPNLMFTDPAYGVKLDLTKKKQHIKRPRSNKNKILNDDISDWEDSYKLFPGNVAYVWHAALFSSVVYENLKNCNFEFRQQIIWNKEIFVFGRSNYHWKHEPCFYMVKKGATADYTGDRKQKTVWDARSPKCRTGAGKESTGEEAATEHPSQKPVSICKIGIGNHGKEGDGVYDPFLGSGSTLIACEKLKRKCFGMEFEPKWCSAVIKRWEDLTGKRAHKDGGER